MLIVLVVVLIWVLLVAFGVIPVSFFFGDPSESASLLPSGPVSVGG